MDLELLQDTVRKSGLKKEWLCRQMGMSYPTLHRRMTGETPFSASEIEMFSRVLKLSENKKKAIFGDPQPS